MSKNTLKLITTIAQFLLFFALSSAKGELHIKEMAPKHTYSNTSGVHEYTCDFLYPNRRCVWSFDSIVIDSTLFDYSFPNEDNCTIRSNDSDIGNLTCTGYLSHDNTSVKTALSGGVKLSCRSERVMEECVWKRDGTRVKIGGSYSIVGNGNKTKDCSILIEWITWSELGEWTCHYHSTEYYEETEVLAAFTISAGEDSTSGLVVALSACVSVLCVIVVVMCCEWKCRKTSSRRIKRSNVTVDRV